MNRLIPLLLPASIVPLVGMALYLVSPMLRSSEGTVVSEADVHVERARRLLASYTSGNERLSELLDELRISGVDVSPGGERIEALLERERGVFDAADEAARNRGRGPEAQTLRELEERYRASGGGNDRPLVDAGALGGGTRIRQAALEGLRSRDDQLQAGDGVLSEALTAIREALNVSRGEVQGASVHPEAQRLEGVILSAQAERARREGRRRWDRAGASRDRLIALATQARRLERETRLIADSGIDARLTDISETAATLKGRIAETGTRIDSLDGTITGIRSRIAEWNGKAADARQALERLEQQGIQPAHTEGTDSFAAAYAGASSAYREALNAAQKLEFGALIDARIDDSGDLILGRYIPEDGIDAVGVQRGVVDYADDRAAFASDLEGHEHALRDVTARIEELQALREQYVRRSDHASATREEALRLGAAAFEEYVRLVSEAEAAMADAAVKARGSATALRSARTVAETRRRESSERLAEAGPEQKERSPFNNRAEAGWRTGQTVNEYGQARLLYARIEYERSSIAAAAFAIATTAKSELGVGSADPDAFAVRRDETHTAALEAARDAIAELERSARDLNGSWTVAGQVADAHYLLALLESPLHVRSAIENYQSAVNTRENEPFARSLVERLAVLQSR